MINSVRLQNARMHQDLSLEFEQGVNIIVGPNACGKTTVLEALLLACTGSLTLSKYKNYVGSSNDWLRIDVDIEGRQRTVKVTDKIKYSREFLIEGVTKKRFKWEDQYPTVWFDPEELRLIKGSPSRRRDYFDNLLITLEPGYKDQLNRYTKTLQQRNQLLKHNSGPKDQIFVWNLRLVEYATSIIRYRQDIVARLNQALGDAYQDLSKTKRQVEVGYASDTPFDNYESILLRQLEANLNKDKSLGFTTYGPHRDDYLFTSGEGVNFADHASRGEVRSLVMSLKTIQVNLVEEVFGQKPLLLFDDVFSELDGSRRHAFTDYLSTHQAIVTTTDADVVTKDFSQSASVIALA